MCRTLLLLLPLLPTSSLFAQTRINGTCILNPNVRNARIVLYLINKSSRDTIGSAEAELRASIYSYRFERPVAPGTSLVVKGVVLNNRAYSQSIASTWLGNPHKVYFSRGQDRYATYLGKANDALVQNDLKSAAKALTYISANQEDLGLTNSQLFETYLNLGAVASKNKDFGLQLAFLDTVSQKVSLDSLRRSQINRYARDKFNAFLLENNYGTSVFPIYDISEEIANKNELFEKWKALVDEIGKYYKIEGSEQNKDAVKDQIITLQNALNKP